MKIETIVAALAVCSFVQFSFNLKSDMVEVFRQDYSKVASNAMLNPTILSMQVKRQGENFPLRRTLTTPHTVSHWTKAMCWSSLWAAGWQKPWQIVLLNFTKPENEEESMWTNIFWTFTENKCAEDVVTKICKELSIYFCKKKILCKKKRRKTPTFFCFFCLCTDWTNKICDEKWLTLGKVTISFVSTLTKLS